MGEAPKGIPASHRRNAHYRAVRSEDVNYVYLPLTRYFQLFTASRSRVHLRAAAKIQFLVPSIGAPRRLVSPHSYPERVSPVRERCILTFITLFYPITRSPIS